MLKFMLSLLLILSLIFPCAAHAGRTKVDQSLYDEILTLAKERQAFLMDAMDNLKLAQNGGSMMKTTFYGSPMVWAVDASYGRNSIESLWFLLNETSKGKRSYIRLGNSVLWEEGGKTERADLTYYGLGRVLAECLPVLSATPRQLQYIEQEIRKTHEFRMNARLDEYDKYIKKATLPDRQKMAREHFWSKMQGLLDLDKECNAAFTKEFNELYPQYIFTSLMHNGITDWAPTEEWRDMRKNDNTATAIREWNKKYIGRRNEAKLFDEFRSFAIPEELSFAVGSFRFGVDAQLAGNARIAGIEQFANLMQGLVDAGKATHEVKDGYDIYADAQSENGLKGRILLDRAKGLGFWEPAMFGEMDKLRSAFHAFDEKTFELYKKLSLYVDQVMREAVALGVQGDQGDGGAVDAL